MKIVYVPCFFSKKLNRTIKKSLIKKLENFECIAIFSTVQHLNSLDEVKNFLESIGKKVIFGGGQILGCNTERINKIEKKVDAFLYIGSGKFHPFVIALKTDKSIFILNPYSQSIEKISDEEKIKYMKKRKWAIAKAIEGKTFGILVSTKTKQFNLKIAKKIKEKLRKKGKKAFFFAGDEILPERLLGFNIDIWINTACPRIVEDYFDKPMLNPEELKFII